MKATPGTIGAGLHDLATRLYPICRSITGNGVRQSLRIIGESIPLTLREVPSGSAVFDWEVPLEWNIRDAYVCAPDGRRVIDFNAHNLHIVSYSEPVRTRLTLEELRPRLHVHATRPDWIPYRTSYYTRNWGFCLTQRTRDSLEAGTYEVVVDSRLEKGSLTYGECVIPGRTRDEVLLYTHVCHPSLANDNASGMAIATRLAEWIASAPRRFTYRLVFGPGTIGSLCWLKQNERRLNRIRHGLVLGLLGDSGPLTYKRSRRGDAEIDAIAGYVLDKQAKGNRLVPFEPYGYDERQLCSPGFNLPVGRLTRSANGGYPEYHSSADDLTLIRPQQLEDSLATLQEILQTVEDNRRYVNLSPKGEPRLGKRGLYGAVGGQSPSTREHAMLWVLSDSDGYRSLLETALRSAIPFVTLRDAALAMADKKLLAVEPERDVLKGKKKQASKRPVARRLKPVAKPRRKS